jgi:hypothetical protein
VDIGDRTPGGRSVGKKRSASIRRGTCRWIKLRKDAGGKWSVAQADRHRIRGVDLAEGSAGQRPAASAFHGKARCRREIGQLY